MKVATFYVGHNVGGKPHWSHARVLSALALVRAFPGGFTAWEAVGRWNGGQEATTVCQVVGITGQQAYAARVLLEFAFRQEKVLCTIREEELV